MKDSKTKQQNNRRGSFRRPGGRNGPAAALIDLLLAIAITTLIGSAVATVLFVTSYASSTQKGLQDAIVTNEVAAVRLGAALRAAKMILAKGDNHLVLWMADTRVNDEPDLSELRRIERDPTTDQIKSYKAPIGLTEEQDITYELLSTDFSAVTESLKGSENFPATLWAESVTAWTTTVDASNPRQCGFVGFKVTTTIEGAAATRPGGAALRNH